MPRAQRAESERSRTRVRGERPARSEPKASEVEQREVAGVRVSDCIFCQIVAGDAPCDLVHEDELTVTFMDLFPVGRGHLLVVPKAHAENLFEIPEPALEQVVRNTRCLALALREVFSPDGIGVHQLNGAAAGQTVFHYHVHLIPRMQGGPRFVHGRVQGDPAELSGNARLISAALAGQPVQGTEPA